MQVRFDREAYHNRCQVETVMSMIKRRQGFHTAGHSYHSQCRDLYLMALTHNAMILVIIQVFYRAVASPFLPRPLFFPALAIPRADALSYGMAPLRGFGS